MCITLSNQGSSEFILSGIVGEDGKPVRVKVKNRMGIRKLLKRKKWNKKGGERSKQRQGHGRRRKGSHARRNGNGVDSSMGESEGSISSSDDDNSDKGESSKRRQGHTRKKKKKKGSHAKRTGNGVDSSMGESEGSISSSNDDSGDKGESSRSKRRQGHGRRRRNARRNGNGVDSSMDDDSISSSDDDSDDIIDLPKHFRNHFLKKKKKKSTKSTSQGCCEDGSSDHSSSSTFGSSSFDSDDEATRQHSQQSHHHASQKHGKHGKRRNKQRHGIGKGISDDDEELDDTCTTSSESELEGSSSDLHTSRTKARRRQKRSNKNRVEDDDSHFPPIPDSRRRKRLDSTLPDIDDDCKQEDHSKRRAVYDGRRDTLTDTTATDHFQLPSIAEASHRIHSQSDARHPKSSSRHRLSDVQHLPRLTPGHVHMMQQGSNGDMSGSDSYVDPAARSRRAGQLASTQPHGVSLHDSTSSSTQKSLTSRRGSMMNYMESKSGSSGNKLQRDSTTLSDKTATVQQDVHLPVKRQNKGQKKGKQNRNKSLNVSEGLSKIQATKTGGKTAGQEIARLPDDEKMAGQEIIRLPDEQTNHRVDFQQLQAQDDNHARRIGRKIVKKTRNNSHQLADKRMTINHNSKDMGNTTGPQQDDDDMPIDGSVTTYRNGTQHLEMIPSAEEIDQSSGEKCRANLFSNTTQRTSFGPISGKTSMSQLQQQAKYNSMTPMPSSSSNQTEVEYISSGLGTKFTSNYKPVRLTPLEEPLSKLSLEFTVGKRPNIVIPPLGQAVEPTLMPTDDPKSPHDEQEAPSGHCKPGDDSGLEVSTEEDDSNDEEIIFPLLDLKPISGLSFTSPFSYSTFPMAVQYREAYEIVQRKALAPVRYGRVKAAKVTRKRRQ